MNATPKSCPTCKGTGTEPVPNDHFKCIECDGDGKFHKMVMLFWKYDHFPFVLGTRGFIKSKGTGFAISYNMTVKPIKTMTLDEGQKLKEALDKLELTRRDCIQAIHSGFELKLNALAPWVLNKPPKKSNT